MVKQRFSYLLERYGSCTITEPERQELMKMLNSSQEKEALVEVLADLMWAYPVGEEDHSEELKQLIQNVVAVDKSSRSPVLIMRRRSIIAAAVAAAIITGILLFGSYWNKGVAPGERGMADKIAKGPAASIKAGKTGAVLTLADGTQVVLDSIKEGVVALQEGANAKVNGGRLAYEMHGSSAGNNTLSTPRGGQYQLTLSDGTRVWLNAASSITYPTAFKGPERNVIISGEAYFEVAADPARPFKVNAGGQQIEVLGTSFNVNVYDDEPVKKTTLLTGAIAVQAGSSLATSRQKSVTSVILHANEQAQLTAGNGIVKVEVANGRDVVAWKDGSFSFKSVDIATIMRQVERWYNVNVIYPSGIPADRFSGTIPRSVNLDQFLEILRYSDIKIKVNGNTVTITP